MSRTAMFSVVLVLSSAFPAFAQPSPIAAKASPEAAAARFAAVLEQALGALARAGSYALDVENQWGAVNDPQGPRGSSRYRLIWQAGKYRIEVQSQAAADPQLLCVNDGAHVTTFLPARGLYSQHPVASPQASIEGNTMLALSLQGSAMDILLQRDVTGYVRAQASDLTDRGIVRLGQVKAHHFELVWAGAQVQVWFAAEGEPLLVQYRRTTTVPTASGENYQQVSTSRFQWKLGVQADTSTFTLRLPENARRVSDIYDALSGEEASTRIGRPLPKLTLSGLDGSEIELAAAADKKATVLIFWATWCAASVDDLAAISQFVKAYKDRGVAFYAVNAGEQPGDVRRFTAKSPLDSTVLLDPRSRASSALRISALPAVVVVAPDNTVRAILQGPARQLQADLAAQLDPLLAGGPASTARRPGEPAAQAK